MTVGVLPPWLVFQAATRLSLVSSICSYLDATGLSAVAGYSDAGGRRAYTPTAAAWWTALSAAIRARSAVSVGSIASGAAVTLDDARWVGPQLGDLGTPQNAPGCYLQLHRSGLGWVPFEPPVEQTTAWQYIGAAFSDWADAQGYWTSTPGPIPAGFATARQPPYP